MDKNPIENKALLGSTEVKGKPGSKENWVICPKCKHEVPVTHVAPHNGECKRCLPSCGEKRDRD